MLEVFSKKPDHHDSKADFGFNTESYPGIQFDLIYLALDIAVAMRLRGEIMGSSKVERQICSHGFLAIHPYLGARTFVYTTRHSSHSASLFSSTSKSLAPGGTSP